MLMLKTLHSRGDIYDSFIQIFEGQLHESGTRIFSVAPEHRIDGIP